MEHTREALAEDRLITPRWQRLAFSALGRHRLLLTGSTLLALAQRVRLVPARLGLPRLAVRRGPRPRDTGNDAWVFTGCVMEAWQRETHRATADVMTAVGETYSLPRSGGDCCGALHVHAGLDDAARRLATRVMASMPGDAPVVVNSAGCGAALKDYGHLLGTEDAAAFAKRVVDVHEWLVPRLERLTVTRRHGSVIVQDPCHLRHVQRAHLPVREVLGCVADVIELDDEGLCCGAGGAYSALQPELAGTIRERKVGAIRRAEQRSGATVVASANPGCAMHLGAVGVNIRHPIDLVAEAIR
jgi:glycolate oxidase iron-sulfur subunit